MRNLTASLMATMVIGVAMAASAETIQLEREHGIYMVPVRINDAITLPFVLDTGATSVVIPADVFLTLTRTGTVKARDFIGTATIVLADGSEHSSDEFILHEVRVGNHVIRNVTASVTPVKRAHLRWHGVDQMPHCTSGTIPFSSTTSPSRWQSDTRMLPA
jgi:predicted aspartyl protease